MNALVEIEVQCPSCGEWFPEWVDATEGSRETVIDCQICCRPIFLRLECGPDGVFVCEGDSG